MYEKLLFYALVLLAFNDTCLKADSFASSGTSPVPISTTQTSSRKSPLRWETKPHCRCLPWPSSTTATAPSLSSSTSKTTRWMPTETTEPTMIPSTSTTEYPSDERCTKYDATCSHVRVSCDGKRYRKLCGGGVNRTCCFHKELDENCTDVGGECKNHQIDDCDGSYILFKCSGPNSRRCCVPACTMTEEEMGRLRDQLKIDEREVDHIYLDSRRRPTFGIGHLITPDDPEFGQPINTPVSEERIIETFNADVLQALKDLSNWASKCGIQCDKLPGEVKEILANMMFNLGLTKMNKFVDLRQAICDGDWATAADEMEDSDWYRQVGDRSKRLVERMRNFAESQ